jgi:hypothetical protein
MESDNRLKSVLRETPAHSDPVDLYSSFKKIMIPIRDKRKAFIPENSLEEIVCDKTVAATLAKHKSISKAEIPKLTKFVCSKARKVFAILAGMGAEMLID